MSLKLHQFPPVWGRNASPFALKLESWLRLGGIPYEIVPDRSTFGAPKRKLPYVEDDDLLIADSSLIIEHLKTTRGIDPDRALDAVARAELLALQRLLEEHLYFILVYSRWLDPDGWRAVRPAMFDFLPQGVRQVAPQMVRLKIRRDLVGQGIGRHARDEVYAMGRDDLEALARLLDDGPFFARDLPGTIDTVAYGVLANILLVPVETELKQIALRYPNLVSFCHLMEREVQRAEGARPAPVAPEPAAAA